MSDLKKLIRVLEYTKIDCESITTGSLSQHKNRIKTGIEFILNRLHQANDTKTGEATAMLSDVINQRELLNKFQEFMNNQHEPIYSITDDDVEDFVLLNSL